MSYLLNPCYLILVASVYVLARNQWVCRKRIALIDKDFKAYLAAPTYNQMLFRYFWDWNFGRLVARGRT